MTRGPDRPGVVILDKPCGPSSFDMVRRVRQITGCHRVGHGGTLDPFASGVLVLALGQATRLLQFVSHGHKQYLLDVCFGSATDTHDRTGTEVSRGEIEFERADLVTALAAFQGTIQQRPPRASAIHVDGQRAYHLHRAGKLESPLPAREVHVRSIELCEWNAPVAHVRVRCGGGTYMRAIARDLGEALGCPAHLQELRRESVGSFGLDDACSLEQLQESPTVLPPTALTRDWPRIDIDAQDAFRVRQGWQPVGDSWLARMGDAPRAAVVDAAGALVAVASRREGGVHLGPVFTGVADAGA